MELISILFYAAIAGAGAGLFSSIVAPIFSTDGQIWRQRHWSIEVGGVLTQLAGGLALGLLFWLSWGLTAIVGVTWWVRGISFASLSWFALALPMLLNQAIHARVDTRLMAKAACDSLLTCAAVGLACAWSWSVGR